MLIVLLFLLVYGEAERVCNISVPISQWLRNNTGPCDAVKGHFILDNDANQYTRKIFSTFSSLTRIDGCIYVREYVGSKNLAFFSKLEHVTCSEKEAELANLTNVIDIVGPDLNKMGFNSLKQVEGPGNIVLSYEEKQQPYSTQEAQNGKQCFSKKEQVFLAYHPQFKRTMYQTCETDDPCYRLDVYKRWYTVSDIPKNCTVFVGPICLIGTYEENAFLDSFQNLTLLIGQLQVIATLFDSLHAVFPKLENIYPFARPNTHRWSKTCQEDPMTNGIDATQFAHVSLNRFMKNTALPSLLPIRPVDVSRYLDSDLIYLGVFNDQSYLPETVPDPCEDYPGFTCGYYTNPKLLESDWENHVWIEETWVLAMICVAVGVAFSIRSTVLLQFSNAKKGLPHTLNFIIFVIAVSTLIALESCIFYQKTFTVFTGALKGYYQFPEFSSNFLFYQPIQWLMCFLVACRHVCMVIIILCYVDIISFYRIGSFRISLVYSTLVAILALFLIIYLNSQLTVVVRGRRPNYIKNSRVIFIPFIMNHDGVANFSKWVPSDKYLTYFSGLLSMSMALSTTGSYFQISDVPLDVFGKALTTFSNICDFLMVTVVIIFYLITHSLGRVIPRHRFIILIGLENIMKPYMFKTITCYTEFEYEDYLDHNKMIRDVAFMEKYQWDILEKLLEKLPYFSYAIVSFYCYKFAKYHHYFGAVVLNRETKKEQKTGETKASESTSYRIEKKKKANQ